MPTLVKHETRERKGYVKLPARTQKVPPNSCGQPTIETNPDVWQVEMLARVQVPSNLTCRVSTGFDLKGNHVERSTPDNHILLLFQDKVSKKVFWWEGRRGNSEHLLLRKEESTYNNWPQEMYQITKRNFKTFIYKVYGFGAEKLMALEEEEQKKIEKQKRKMVQALEALKR